MLPLVIGESFVFYSLISLSRHFQLLGVGRVLKVEITTPIALICKWLFPSISTFETPPARDLSPAARAGGLCAAVSPYHLGARNFQQSAGYRLHPGTSVGSRHDRHSPGASPPPRPTLLAGYAGAHRSPAPSSGPPARRDIGRSRRGNLDFPLGGLGPRPGGCPPPQHGAPVSA